MDGRKVMEEIKKARWEMLKNTIDNPDKITMTQNVFDAIVCALHQDLQLRVVNPKDEPKAYIYGMEIEIIGDGRGYFSIGGLMKGVS